MLQQPLNPTEDADAAELPWSERITDYDTAHLCIYARLLDAEAAGESHEQMMDAILGLDAGRAASKTQLTHHLKRAHWMRRTGYRLLLADSAGSAHA